MIASNFGFLYNPSLRLLFYVLMGMAKLFGPLYVLRQFRTRMQLTGLAHCVYAGMVAWSFETLIGMIASVALGLLALVNTYVLCRYPGYRAVLKDVSDEQEKTMRREGFKRGWRY